MKNTLFMAFTALFSTLFMACGTDPAKAPTSPPVEAEVKTIAVVPKPTIDAALIGNWIDLGGNVLSFYEDGKAKSNNLEMEYSVSNDTRILLVSSDIKIDDCAYAILSSGGLNKPWSVVLDLACDKAGQLSYTRAD